MRREPSLFKQREPSAAAFFGYAALALAYCVSVAYAIHSATLLRFTMGQTAVCCLLFLLLLYAVTYNKITVIVSCALALTAGLLLAAVGGSVRDAVWSYAQNTAGIVFSDEFEARYALGMFALICFSCAAYTTLFLRLTVRFLPLFLLGMAVFTFELLFRLFDAPAAFYLFMLCMAALLMLRSKDARRQRISHARVFGRYLPTVLPICLTAALIGAVCAAPLGPEPVRTLHFSVQSASEAWGDLFGATYRFDFRRSGFHPGSSDLGGDVKIDHTEILSLRVNTDLPHRLYLQGAAKRTYTSGRWSNPPGSGSSRPVPVEDAANPGRMGQFYGADTIYAVPLRERMETLFLPAYATMVDIGDREVYAERDGTRRLRPPLRADEEYMFVPDYAHYADWVAQNYRDVVTGTYPGLFAQHNDSAYTQLPADLPPRVRELAEELTRDCGDDFTRVKALETYLRHFTYTLTPGAVPRGRDFVDYFLFDTQEGYCTYYATAFCVLARTLGLPTRYVEGYVARQGGLRAGRTEVITNAQAHAWPEVYFDGIGWVQFEPTAPYALGQYRDGMRVSISPEMRNNMGFWQHMQDMGVTPGDTDIQPENPPVTQPGGTTTSSGRQTGTGTSASPGGQTSPPSGGTTLTPGTSPPPPPKGGGTASPGGGWLTWLLAALAGVVGIGAGGVYVLYRRSRRAARRPPRLRGDQALASAHLRELTRLLTVCGHRRRMYETPSQFTRRCGVAPLPEDAPSRRRRGCPPAGHRLAETLDAAANAYDDAYYGDKTLSAAQRTLLPGSVAALRQYARRALGRLRYRWRRLLRR